MGEPTSTGDLNSVEVCIETEMIHAESCWINECVVNSIAKNCCSHHVVTLALVAVCHCASCMEANNYARQMGCQLYLPKLKPELVDYVAIAVRDSLNNPCCRAISSRGPPAFSTIWAQSGSSNEESGSRSKRSRLHF